MDDLSVCNSVGFTQMRPTADWVSVAWPGYRCQGAMTAGGKPETTSCQTKSDWLQALSVVAEIVGATVEITCASLPCLTAHWYTVAQVRGLLALPPCGMAVHFPELSKHQPWYAHCSSLLSVILPSDRGISLCGQTSRKACHVSLPSCQMHLRAERQLAL